MNFSNMVLIALVLTGFTGCLNYYFLSRLFPFYRRPLVRYLFLAVTAAAIFITYESRVRPPSSLDAMHGINYALLYAAIAWLCGQFALLLAQPFLYVAVKRLQRTNPSAPEASSEELVTRRAFLRGAVALTILLPTGVGAKGVYQSQASMTMREHTLTFPGLPLNLRGFKIGQLSDTHLGPYFSLQRLDTAIDLLMRQKPDLLVITGDFVDDMNLLAPAISRLNSLQPLIPRGIYFCLGNHEYIRNVSLVRTKLAQSRVVLLENSSRLILPGPQPLYLLGADYPGSAIGHRGMNISVDRRQQCFAAANQDIPSEAFKVLIAHHPDFLIDGFAARIPLTLAGHTHGGQVVIAGKPLFYSQASYIGGLYQENGVYGYVSSGAGQWFPFRMGCPPEVSLFTLQD